MEVKALMRQGLSFVERNSPYILTALGAAGVVGTAVMTGRATIKACDILEAERGRRLQEAGPDATYSDVEYICWQEKVKLCWKPYISPCLMGLASVACIVGANSVSAKRNAAIAAAYSIAETTLKDYQEKVIEEIGEKKEEKIRGKVAEKYISEHPPVEDEIIYTDRGKTLCFDVMSGRYFKHDIENIRRIVNDLNHDLMGVMWVNLNDFYYALGLPGVKMGDDLGWTVDELIDVQFTSKLTDDGEPCLVLDYDITPKYLKNRYHGGL